MASTSAPSADAVGADPARIERVRAWVRAEIDAGRSDGMDLLVLRHGEEVLSETTGWADRDADVPLDGHVLCTMSLIKAMTAVVTLRQVERGLIALGDPVADVIPEFASGGKARITLGQLLTHAAGMPWGVPTHVDIGDLDAMVALACGLQPETPPGEGVSYSATIGWAVLGELTRRLVDPARSYTQVMDDELFGPLGMADTSVGLPARLADRYAPVRVRFTGDNSLPAKALEGLNHVMAAGGELPAGGAVSTAADVARFGEMLRRGGELDGVRILSPAMVRLAARNHTGDAVSRVQAAYNREVHGVDPKPANLGLGFWTRGDGLSEPPFGSLNAPGTYGIPGAGSAMLWIDPALDATFAALSTGLMEGWASSKRYERLSDLVIAALTD